MCACSHVNKILVALQHAVEGFEVLLPISCHLPQSADLFLRVLLHRSRFSPQRFQGHLQIRPKFKTCRFRATVWARNKFKTAWYFLTFFPDISVNEDLQKWKLKPFSYILHFLKAIINIQTHIFPALTGLSCPTKTVRENTRPKMLSARVLSRRYTK